MYAIAFDIISEQLKKHYGENYYSAYDEIKKEMNNLGFKWIQNNLYITKEQENNLINVYNAINKLSKIEWFKKSVRDIRAFKVENWSDFTNIVKTS